MPNRHEEKVITPGLLRAWPLPDPQGDKESRGTVLVVGGSRFTPGAVLLAGVAALRAGAGRLQLAVDQTTAAALSIAVPEAKVVGLPEKGADVPGELLDMAAQVDVLAIGPGLDDIDETPGSSTSCWTSPASPPGWCSTPTPSARSARTSTCSVGGRNASC